MRVGACWLAGLVIAVGTAAAQEEGRWRLGIGLAGRQFGDVEFKSAKLRNYGAMHTPGGPFGIQGYSVLPGLSDGSGVTTDQVRFKGDEDGTGWEWGPVLSVERDLWSSGRFTLSLAGSLGYYTMEADLGSAGGRSAPGRFVAAHHNYLTAGGQVLAPPINDNPLSGFSPGTSASVQLRDFELDLLVFDIGPRGRYDMDRFYLLAGCGPAFYWARAESQFAEGGAWNAIPGTGDTGSYRMPNHDSGSDTAFGVFVSLGAGVKLTERLAIELEGRLDRAAGSVGTSHAEVDLDGFSGLLKLVIGF